MLVYWAWPPGHGKPEPDPGQQDGSSFIRMIIFWELCFLLGFVEEGSLYVLKGDRTIEFDGEFG